LSKLNEKLAYIIVSIISSGRACDHDILIVLRVHFIEKPSVGHEDTVIGCALDKHSPLVNGGWLDLPCFPGIDDTTGTTSLHSYHSSSYQLSTPTEFFAA